VNNVIETKKRQESEAVARDFGFRPEVTPSANDAQRFEEINDNYNEYAPVWNPITRKFENKTS